MLQFSTKNGLSGNRIRSIQEDKQGNIFISSLGGINKFDGQTLTTLTPVKIILPEIIGSFKAMTCGLVWLAKKVKMDRIGTMD
ncbi:MAG: hypothetical protein IPG90_09815 [Bacteroidetes bacterium]|nr:hypothetical protein [Bacteroidota bacterium]